MSGFPQSDVEAVMDEAQASYELFLPRYEAARRARDEAASARVDTAKVVNRARTMLKKGAMSEDTFDSLIANQDAIIEAHTLASDEFNALTNTYLYLRFMAGEGRDQALKENDDPKRPQLDVLCRDGGGHQLSIGTITDQGWAGTTLNCTRCNRYVVLPRLDAVLAIYDLARRLGILGELELLPDV